MALTTTSVSAHYNEDILKEAGLSNDQIEAFQEAHELKQAGEWQAARDTLLEAGIDEEVLRSLRAAKREVRAEHREELKVILEDEDYDAFLAYAADKPIGDIVTSESDFELLVEAHVLRQNGDREEARQILDDLGFERREGHGGKLMRAWRELSEDEREALRVAKSANDKETVRAILREAGVDQ